MEKLHIRFMQDLRNFEFGELFDLICTIIASKNIDNPLLSKALKQLTPHSKELLQLQNQTLKNPLTQVIKEQVNTRTEYLACLRMTIEAKKLTCKPAERIAANRLALWIETYNRELFAPTILKQNRIVKNLMDDREEELKIIEATTLLDLNDLLDNIVEITSRIEDNYQTRLKQKENTVINGQSIREEAYKALKVYINVLETCHSLSSSDKEKEQIEILSFDLKEELKAFHTILKSRYTKRKNSEKTEKSNVISKTELPDNAVDKDADPQNDNLSTIVEKQLNKSIINESEESTSDIKNKRKVTSLKSIQDNCDSTYRIKKAITPYSNVKNNKTLKPDKQYSH